MLAPVSLLVSRQHPLRTAGLCVLSVSLLAGTAGIAQTFALHPMFAFTGNHHGPTPGYLGIDLRDMTDDVAMADHLKAHGGVEVFTVDHDGPAAKAGLRVRDVITQFNGQPVSDADGLRKKLHDLPPGRTATFLVCRDGVMQTLSAQMVNREELERQSWEQHLTVPDPSASRSGSQSSQSVPHSSGFFSHSNSSPATEPKITGPHQGVIGSVLMGSSYTGAMMETMSPQLADFFGAPVTSLMVRSVDTDSPAASAGLRAGDVVLRVASAPIRNGGDWTKAMHENRGKPTIVTILRDKREQSLTLTPDGKRRSSVELPGPPVLFPTEEARLRLPAVYWME